MDLWQLKIFCKVIELKSFSRAGEAIHLSQPTVSSHIKDLEEHFDCRLIDRLGKEALPTRSGDLLYGYAKKLLALKMKPKQPFPSSKVRPKGILSLGGAPFPADISCPRSWASSSKNIHR